MAVEGETGLRWYAESILSTIKTIDPSQYVKP